MSIQKHQKNEIVKFDREAFALKFSPKNMRKEFRHVNSLKKAVEADSNSIAVYRKQSSPEFIEGMIEIYLHDLNNSLNVHEKLNEFQIEEIAIEISTLYYQLSMVEIHLIFKEAKRGKYGRINYALNMPDVLGWFDKYAEERCQYFMQLKTSEGIEHKQNAQSSIVDKAALEVLSEFKTTLSEDISKKDAEFEIFKSNIKK